IRYLFHIQIQQAERPPDEMQTHPDAQGGPPSRSGPSGSSRLGGAAAAVAASAARASEPVTQQRLPDVARQFERKPQRKKQDLQYQPAAAKAESPKPVRAGAKVGRNDPCPCGSGKKYKKCHGVNA